MKKEINILYFFLFFVGVASTVVFARDWTALFLLYGLLQACFETALLLIFSFFLPEALLAILSFTLILVHYTNFTIVRLLDTQISYIFRFFFGSGVKHMVAGFQALNFNGSMIILIVATLLSVPFLALFLYRITRKINVTIPLKPLNLATLVLLALLLLTDLSLDAKTYNRHRKILPLGIAFIPPKAHHLQTPDILPPFREEIVDLPDLKCKHLPTVYLFVIETFRKDYLSVAPYLTDFAKENLTAPNTFSNASATHLAWFSIIHADCPMNWTLSRDSWKQGSIPLRLLKQMGYEINVFSSADFHYFNADEFLLGKERKLADHIFEFSPALEAHERDALCMQKLKETLKKSGQVNLIFLDSTHSEYSFPKDFPLRYTPIAKEVDYLTIGPNSQQLEPLKNRYRNAICYIDSLLGDFFHFLKEKNLYAKSPIIITGDHGEEFFEEGALFHGTHLNTYQTSVPILLHLPKNPYPLQTNTITHVDIFPTLLHYLTGKSHFDDLFDGVSIFDRNHGSRRYAILQNGSEAPKEFILVQEDLFLHARKTATSALEILHLQGFLENDSLDALLK